jgi:hypothetical protein
VLSSWLARLAYRHGVTTLRLCRTLFYGEYGLNRDIDKLIKPGQIELLAERTNTTIEEVQATTLASYKNILLTCLGTLNKEPWLLPNRLLRDYDQYGARHHHFNSGLLFCPMCLRKNAYFKKQWRLALSFVCTECGCYLLDTCPHCGSGNSFMEVEDVYGWNNVDQYMLGCHSCRKDVTECEVDPAPVELVGLQKHLYNIMECGTAHVPYIRESYLKVLHAICTLLLRKNNWKLMKFAEDVFELNDLTCKAFRYQELRLLNTEQRADVIKSAHWLLQKWPKRFLNLCKNNYLERRDVLAGLPMLPSWFTEPIYYGLKEVVEGRYKYRLAKPVEYTAKSKVMPIKAINYDFDIDEYFDEEELYYQPKPGYKRLSDHKYIPMGFNSKR